MGDKRGCLCDTLNKSTVKKLRSMWDWLHDERGTLLCSVIGFAWLMHLAPKTTRNKTPILDAYSATNPSRYSPTCSLAEIFTKMGDKTQVKQRVAHTPWTLVPHFLPQLDSASGLRCDPIAWTCSNAASVVVMSRKRWPKKSKTHFFPWNKWIRNVDELWRYRHVVYRFGCSNRCVCLRFFRCSKPQRSQP